MWIKRKEYEDLKNNYKDLTDLQNKCNFYENFIVRNHSKEEFSNYYNEYEQKKINDYVKKMMDKEERE